MRDRRWGWAFVSDNWGAVAGCVLIGLIFAISPNGVESIWAGIAVGTERNTLRPTAFMPLVGGGNIRPDRH